VLCGYRAAVRTFEKLSITRRNRNPLYRGQLIEIYISQKNISTDKFRTNKISNDFFVPFPFQP
jgi:hypothetical protein